MLAASSSSSCPIINPLFFFCRFKLVENNNNNNIKKPFASASASAAAAKFPVAITTKFPVATTTKSCQSRSCSSSFSKSISSPWQTSLDLAGECEEEKEEEEEKPPKIINRVHRTPLLDAVVKVFCVGAKQDFSCPWQREPKESCSSGFIARGRRVLTSAYSVDQHTQVKLKKHNCDTLYTATVLAVAPESNLAILTVSDEEFWKGVKPVEFGDMQTPKGKLSVTGYSEEEGDYVSVMRARVLRVGMTRYCSWDTKLLAFEVNATGKRGISGGPVFDERGKCVGMEFQPEGNTSDVIPAQVIKHFIQDYEKNGSYTGLPILGIKWQKMENLNLRKFMKMEHDHQGVLITDVKPNYPEFKILKPYDVILSIDGININNDGTVPFTRGRRIEFSYLITQKYTGDKIIIKVLRDSEIHEFNIVLPTHKQFMPANITGMPLSYYIIGGFVFTTLSVPYLQFMDYRYFEDFIPEEDELLSQALYEERVLLCKVLKADISIGYEEEYIVQNQVLVTFNDKPIQGLKSLVSMVESCNEEFLKFTLENHKILVLPTTIARARTPDILKAHCIPSAMSDDLKKQMKLARGKESLIGSFSKSFSVRDEISAPGQTLLDLDGEYEDDKEEEEEEQEEEQQQEEEVHPNLLLDSVVKVFCVNADPDFSCPWRRENEEVCSSGYIIRGRRVLTCARFVEQHAEVKLKKHHSDTWYIATVLAMAPECDLALLTVSDDEFWKGVKPVEFGDMPAPKDKLTVTGYLDEGDCVFVMRARVSSVGMNTYYLWRTKLLALQVNVARKKGTCGGPVFDERGKCVGMRFQDIGNKKYDVIPAQVIKHFIEDYDKNGAYTGLPILAIKWQKMENPNLRMFMKMDHDHQGVLITEVKPNYPESKILKPYDVILSIDGININNNGTVPFTWGEGIEFSYLIARKYKGDKIVIKVLRDSKIHEFIMELATHKQFVPADITRRPLSYYIIGGFVFTILSVTYLQLLDERYTEYSIPEEDELLSQALYEERVVLSKVLKADVNTGYEEEGIIHNQVVITFNDKPVHGLKSLVSMVESCDEEFLKFTLNNREVLVLPTVKARARTPIILKRHCIPCAMSDDLKKQMQLS